MNIYELIEKSNKSIYSLTMKELHTLVNHYEQNDNLEHYEKVERLKKAIARLEIKLNKPKHLQQWELDAMESIALTEKWEAHGAYWKNYNDWKTQWFYNDICFYEWTKGSHVSDMIIEQRKADKYFDSLIDSEKAV